MGFCHSTCDAGKRDPATVGCVFDFGFNNFSRKNHVHSSTGFSLSLYLSLSLVDFVFLLCCTFLSHISKVLENIRTFLEVNRNEVRFHSLPYSSLDVECILISHEPLNSNYYLITTTYHPRVSPILQYHASIYYTSQLYPI